MKTKLMADAVGLEEEFKTDFGLFVSLSEEQFETLANWLGRMGSYWADMKQADIDNLVTEMQLERRHVNSVLKAIYYLHKAAKQSKDNASDIMEDFQEMDLIQADQVGKAKNRLTRVFELLTPASEVESDLTYCRLILPNITGIQAVADLRMRVREEFESDEEKPEEYRPQMASLLPVGLCRLTLKTGNVESHATFQVTPKQLDSLIGHLIALQKTVSLLSNEAKNRGKDNA